MKKFLVLLLISISFVWISCEVLERATPVPREKEVFVGTWKSASGFTIEIKFYYVRRKGDFPFGGWAQV